jgi:hypothetical protein
MTDIIVDHVQILGTNRRVWKAWKRCDGPSQSWPHSYGFQTITHFNGIPYGRMGTERFDCPTVPDEYRHQGRSADWRWKKFIEHKVAMTRAAHFEIMRAMPKTEAKLITFETNGTVEMEV